MRFLFCKPIVFLVPFKPKGVTFLVKQEHNAPFRVHFAPNRIHFMLNRVSFSSLRTHFTPNRVRFALFRIHFTSNRVHFSLFRTHFKPNRVRFAQKVRYFFKIAAIKKPSKPSLGIIFFWSTSSKAPFCAKMNFSTCFSFSEGKMLHVE